MRRRLSPAFFGEPLLNPIPLLLGVLLLAVAGSSTSWAAAALAGMGVKAASDSAVARRLRGRALCPSELLLVPVKDLMIAGLWLVGAFRRTICWRGHRLRVGRGSLLTPVESALESAPVPALQEVA
jgi:ceramide glucosyltransferase